MDRICRICLREEPSNRLHDIFTKNEESLTIALTLMECAPVEVSK